MEEQLEEERVPAIEPQRSKEGVIEGLEKPIQRILEKMRPKIEAGAYDLIIGDDASARVPTRIFEKVINAIYDTHHTEHPKIMFISGSTGVGRPNLDEKQKNILAHLLERGVGKSAKRALIVTDVISTGQAVRAVGEMLAMLGVSFDVASLLAEEDSYVVDKIQTLGRGAVFSGNGMLDIYGRKDLSGVQKNARRLFSEPHARGSLKSQQKLNTARYDAFAVADRLIAWYTKSV